MHLLDLYQLVSAKYLNTEICGMLGSESIVRELISLHAMQAKVLDHGFPNGIAWWGTILAKWPRTACKLQICIFGSKQWCRGAINFFG